MGWTIIGLDHPARQQHHRPRHQKPSNSHKDRKRRQHTEFDTVIPSLCQQPCLRAYLEAESIGKQNQLCSAVASNFKSLHSTCKQCCTVNTSNLEDLDRVNKALYAQFGEFTNYCEAVEAGAAFTPPPVHQSATLSTRTLLKDGGGGTTLVLATATYTVSTETVGAVQTGVGEGGNGGKRESGGERVNTGVIVGAVAGAAMAVIIVLVIGVLFLRGRYKRKVKALEVGSSGRSRSRSGGSSITIGNDAGVVGGDKKEDMLGFEVAELDGAPVVKRAEMDVEGGYRELDGERSYKELDAEFGYGELDVTEKRLSGGEIKEGLEERQVEKEVNTKKKDRMEDVGKVDEGSLIGKEEEIGKGDGNAEEKGGIADEIKQAEEKKDRVNNER